MWQALVVCSSCAEEHEIVVEDLDALDREVCSCEHCCVVVSVAHFEPVYAESAAVIEFPGRNRAGTRPSKTLAA